MAIVCDFLSCDSKWVADRLMERAPGEDQRSADQQNSVPTPSTRASSLVLLWTLKFASCDIAIYTFT